MPHDHPLTVLLHRARDGDRPASNLFYARIYPELERLARCHLARGARRTPLLDVSALVREAYLRMARLGAFPGRDHDAFLAYAARTMRSVVVDELRMHGAARHGHGMTLLELSAGADVPAPDAGQHECLGEALRSLRLADERAYRVVELRFFGGMEVHDIARALAVSTATVKRDWRRARMFLMHRLGAARTPRQPAQRFST